MENATETDATNVRSLAEITLEIEQQIYDTPLNKLSLAALRFLAKKRGMVGIANATKKNLIATITANRSLSGVKIPGA